jgi:anti-sigma regulatory factor (Ser/Thr protein kinase)
MQTACEYSQLKISSDLTYAAVAAPYVGSISGRTGFDESEQSELRAVVTEAFGAIIRTAFEPGHRQGIDISCERVPGGLEIIIKEKGTVPEHVGHRNLLSDGRIREARILFLGRFARRGGRRSRDSTVI